MDDTELPPTDSNGRNSPELSPSLSHRQLIQELIADAGHVELSPSPMLKAVAPPESAVTVMTVDDAEDGTGGRGLADQTETEQKEHTAAGGAVSATPTTKTGGTSKAAATPSVELPALTKVADESLLKFDAVDEVIARQIREKYASELREHSAVERMHFVRRYTLAYRHIKKKKRFAVICRDIDHYWEMHRRYDFDHIISRESTDQQLMAWKQFIYGQSCCGHPVLYDGVGTSDLNLMRRAFMDPAEKTFATEAYRHVFTMMRRTENLKVQMSRHYGATIYRHIQVMDVQGFTTNHLRGKNRKLMGMVVDSLSRMFPDATHRMYIINANWPFRAGWGIIKNFMDPVTVSRTKVLGDDFLKELLKEIPIEMVPKQYGGKGPWEIQYGSVPKGYPLTVFKGID